MSAKPFMHTRDTRTRAAFLAGAIVTLASVFMAPAVVHAEDKTSGHAEHSHAHAPQAADAATARPWVEATVRKVDLAQGKVTLKHGEIPNLDMPPMSMVFKATDPAMLEGLKVGDEVRFQADEVNGSYMAVGIEKR